jgi:hypothetical protein
MSVLVLLGVVKGGFLQNNEVAVFDQDLHDKKEL